MTNIIPDWLLELEPKAPGKRVILVEGTSDTKALSYFLNLLEPNWRTDIALLNADSKKRVQKGVKHYDNWVGIVDRDEWSDEQVQKLAQSSPRLHILPRFCIENYFCVPSELWYVLPTTLKQEIDYGDFEQRILQNLPDWVAHGAMWRVIQKRRSVFLYDSNFPAALDARPVTNIDEIRDVLRSWHTQLDPEQIIQEYQHDLAVAQQHSNEYLLKEYVHGKKFFKQVIVGNVLKGLFGQKSTSQWQEDVKKDNRLALPADLESFLQGILNDIHGLSQ